MSAIEGQFVTFKHISTRGVIQMVIEAPETSAPDVFAHLGYPRSGESLYVAVARLHAPDERSSIAQQQQDAVQRHKELEAEGFASEVYSDDTSPEALNARLDAKLSHNED